jgi:DNA-directed RNA polymerase subunit L
MEVQRCFRVDENGEPNDFTFFVESVGVRSVPECVEDALHSIVAMVKTYQDIDAEVPDNVDIHHGDTRFVCVDFVFKNEDHTLGNLLQHYLVERHIEGTEEPRLSYAGYKVPHPLKKEMVVRVGLPASHDDQDSELQTARLVMAKVCRFLKQFFEQMLVDWGTLHAPTATTATPDAAANTTTNVAE